MVDIFSSRKAAVVNSLARLDKSGAAAALPVDYLTRTGLTRSDILDKIESMRSCAGTIERKVNISQGRETVSTGHHCHNPLSCHICAKRSQGKRRARVLPKIAECSKKYRNIYKITFTLPDGADLLECGSRLRDSLQAFRKMGQRRGAGHSDGEWSKVRAGVMSIENKRGSNSGLWHVHAHAVVFCDDQINFSVYDQDKKRQLIEKYGNSIPREVLEQIRNKELSKAAYEWYLASGGATDIHIERLRKIPPEICNPKSKFYSPEKIQMYAAMSYQDSVISQVKEAVKYDTDFNSIENASDMITILADCRGRRFYSTFGDFRRVDFGRIIMYLRAWCDKRDIDQEQFRQWIIRNTDLLLCRGNQQRLDQLAALMERAGFSPVEISAACHAFDLRYKKYGENRDSILPAGTMSTYFAWDKDQVRYVQTCRAAFDFAPRSELQKGINAITAKYRSVRGRAFRQYSKSPFAYKMLDTAKRLMHSQISELINLWKQKSTYTHRDGAQIAAFTQKLSAYYYASAF